MYTRNKWLSSQYGSHHGHGPDAASRGSFRAGVSRLVHLLGTSPRERAETAALLHAITSDTASGESPTDTVPLLEEFAARFAALGQQTRIANETIDAMLDRIESRLAKSQPSP